MKKSCAQVIAILGMSLGASVATAVDAGEVVECNWQSQARNIVEPWEDNSRTFANGAVRLALLDTVEPGAAPLHILVLSPPYDELGERQCRLVSQAQGFGFAGVDFAALQASYDPSVGLIFELPARVFDPDSGGFLQHELRFTLNQATGAIGAQLQ